MFCNKCGRQIDPNAAFCPYCGNQIMQPVMQPMMQQPVMQQPVQPQPIVQPSKPRKGLGKWQKITIIGLLTVIIVLLALVVFAPSKESVKGKAKRTIMMYIVGSNLESDSKIVTGELRSINPDKINLDETNILLYTGGTEKWHNFISNEENAIYLLTKDGFEKLESQDKLNFGDPKTLTDFIKYAYDNYPAEKFDLLFYDHGGAVDGAIYDDFTNDHLSMHDLMVALKNSPFNENNKLEAVIFRTCLNGTVEIANIFAPYSNYLIASEEVSYGQSPYNVLGFVNETSSDDSGYEIGKKFVDAYVKQMKSIDMYDVLIHTYSVIDLSKIQDVNKLLDEFIGGIDLKNNYNEIARVRASLFQYAHQSQEYNMVDLYGLITKLSPYSTVDSSKLLKAIKDSVLYNYSNNKESNGISIYFPFAGRNAAKAMFLEAYSELTYSEKYKTFINGFYQLQNAPSGFSFSVDKNEVETDDTRQKLSIQLSQDQVDNYAYATFTIFKRDKDHMDYFEPIFNTDDVTLDSNGVLSVDYTNKLLKVKSDTDSKYAFSYYRKLNNVRYVFGSLYKKDRTITDEDYLSKATLYFAPSNDGKPIIGSAKLDSYNERIDGVMLNLNDYKFYEVYVNSYRILDKNGNVLSTDKWEGSPIITGWSGDFENNDDYVYASLDKGDYYYALFIVTDIHENSSYSKLIKVGE